MSGRLRREYLIDCVEIQIAVIKEHRPDELTDITVSLSIRKGQTVTRWRPITCPNHNKHPWESRYLPETWGKEENEISNGMWAFE